MANGELHDLVTRGLNEGLVEIRDDLMNLGVIGCGVRVGETAFYAFGPLTEEQDAAWVVENVSVDMLVDDITDAIEGLDETERDYCACFLEERLQDIK